MGYKQKFFFLLSLTHVAASSIKLLRFNSWKRNFTDSQSLYFALFNFMRRLLRSLLFLHEQIRFET